MVLVCYILATKGHSLGRYCELVGTHNGSCRTIVFHNNLPIKILNEQYSKPFTKLEDQTAIDYNVV